MNFKNTQGSYYLKPIFFELDDTDKTIAIYTLKDTDHTHKGRVYPSLRRAYMETEDPTEYLFATQYLGGWPHWKKLTECNWFKEDLNEWREELSVRLQAKGLVQILKKAADPDGKDNLTAAKFLVERKWAESPKEKTGPRTKDKIKKEAQEMLNASSDTTEDFKRLGLN